VLAMPRSVPQRRADPNRERAHCIPLPPG